MTTNPKVKKVKPANIRKGTIKVFGVPRVTSFDPRTYLVEFILNEDTLNKYYARKLVGWTVWQAQRDYKTLLRFDCLIDQYHEAYRIRITTKDSKGIETQRIIDNDQIDKEEDKTGKTIIP